MVTYLITGCSRGLGLELTKQFVATLSENIISAAARSKTAVLNPVIEYSPGQVRFIPLKVTRHDSVSSAVTAATKKLHGAGSDVFMNNAGI
jgi:NAD(P)-dependent dehydrogenase (short-subunit alcohol dehydrogenase family)